MTARPLFMVTAQRWVRKPYAKKITMERKNFVATSRAGAVHKKIELKENPKYRGWSIDYTRLKENWGEING